MDGGNNLEIVLYLLLAVGGIVVNAYRSYSKKKEAAEQRETRTVDFPEIEIEREYYNTEEQDVLLQEIKEEPEQILTNPQTVFEDQQGIFEEVINAMPQEEPVHDDDISKDNTRSSAEEIREQISNQIKYSWDTPPLVEELQSFDLRKAVIYSEILNAKYI